MITDEEVLKMFKDTLARCAEEYEKQFPLTEEQRKTLEDVYKNGLSLRYADGHEETVYPLEQENENE